MDLSPLTRLQIENDITDMVAWLRAGGQSLGIAREAMIAVFDEAAADG